MQGNRWNYSRCYCKYACTAFLGYFSLPYPPALGRLNQPGTCDDQVNVGNTLCRIMLIGWHTDVAHLPASSKKKGLHVFKSIQSAS